MVKTTTEANPDLGPQMGEASKDLLAAFLSAAMTVQALYYGISWLAVAMAFLCGSMLTFALADWRDKVRRAAGFLKHY